MKRVFAGAAGAALIALLLSAPAAVAWTIEELNRQIEQTNFIVGTGCSGTLISVQHRLIVTNHHCIDSYLSVVEREERGNDGVVRKVRRERREPVTVHQRDYRSHEQIGSVSYVTEIVGHKKERDIAFLRLVGENLRSVADTKLLPDGKEITRGTRVYAVGNPLGLDATVTVGVVSNVNRTFQLPWTGNERVPMIQFDAVVAPGNSGGALLDDDGFFIGIPAAGLPGILSLAIPVFEVKSALRENCLASIYDQAADDAACEAKKIDAGGEAEGGHR